MSKEHSQGTIEVSATGKVEVAPDEAVVRLSIVTEAKTASDASSDNAARTLAVVEAVSAEPNHGVNTSGLGVNPVSSYDPETRTTTITGFRATNRVIVRTKVGYAGQVFDAGIGAGANQSSGIGFRIQEEQPHREQALRQAVTEATANATVVAVAAGLALTGAQTIEINPGAGPAPARALAFRAEATPTPVMPEDLTIAAAVRMIFSTTKA